MPTYGFRVLKFDMPEAPSRRTPLPLAGQAQKLLNLLVEHEGVLFIGRPFVKDPLAKMAAHKRGDEAFAIREGTISLAGGRLSCELTAGLVQEHDDLLQAHAAPEDIKDRIAGRRYRVEFYFPAGAEAAAGLIVTETVSRRSPLGPLLAWLTRWSMEDVAAHDEAVEEDSSEVAGGVARRFRIEQLGDRQHLMDIVKNVSHAEVKFDAATSDAGYTTRGRAKKRDAQLTVVAREDAYLKAIAEEILRWLKHDYGNPVKRLLRATGKKTRLEGDLGLGGANVRLQSKDGPLSVSPGNIADVFTYILSRDLRPADRWRAPVDAKVVELAQQEDIGLEWTA